MGAGAGGAGGPQQEPLGSAPPWARPPPGRPLRFHPEAEGPRLVWLHSGGAAGRRDRTCFREPPPEQVLSAGRWSGAAPTRCLFTSFPGAPAVPRPQPQHSHRLPPETDPAVLCCPPPSVSPPDLPGSPSSLCSGCVCDGSRDTQGSSRPSGCVPEAVLLRGRVVHVSAVQARGAGAAQACSPHEVRLMRSCLRAARAPSAPQEEAGRCGVWERLAWLGVRSAAGRGSARAFLRSRRVEAERLVHSPLRLCTWAGKLVSPGPVCPARGAAPPPAARH